MSAAPAVITTPSAGQARQRALLVGVLVVAIIAACYLLVWKPQGQALTEAKEERATVENQVAMLAAARAAAAAEPDDPARGARLLEAVPAEVAAADVLRQIDALAAQSGVRLTTITLSPPAPLAAAAAPAGTAAAAPAGTAAATAAPVGPLAMTLSLSVDGAEAQVDAFLAGLAPLPRLTVVDQLNVQATTDDAGAPQVTAQLSARVFATGA